MALVNCAECGKEASSEARACPHCGNPFGMTFDAAFKKAAVQHAQQKKLGCGAIFLIGAAVYVLILVFNALVGTSPHQVEHNSEAAYRAGALAGELEARFAYSSGNSFGYPFDRQNAVALAQQKISMAGAFANGPGRQQWIDGFADAFKSYVDGKATELRPIR